MAMLNVDPCVDAFGTAALGLLSNGLPRVLANPADLDARLDCQRGMAMSIRILEFGARVGASHAIGHVFGAHAGLGKVIPGGFGVSVFFFLSTFTFS